MIVIPSVEVRRGVCVGPNGASARAMLGSAVSVVRDLASIGFRQVYLIDGDALAGTGSNDAVIDDVIRDGAVDVDTCDGAATTEHVERLLDAGASRVEVSSRALEDPEWLSRLADSFPGAVIVGTEVWGRRIAARGWIRSLPHDLMDVIGTLADLPLGGLLIKSGVANGAWTNGDLSLLEDATEASALPVMVTGGIESVADLRALDHRGVSAALPGDRLYDGALDPRELAREFSE